MEGEDIMLRNIEHIHFVGIGGIGMSGIAQVLWEMGYKVTGSDLRANKNTRKLETMGIKINIGHHERAVEGSDVIVFSSAIPETNIEIIEAKKRCIPILKRAEMLAEVMKEGIGIAVAGAHGKTTTTSMISLILEKNNLDPTIIIGGELQEIGGNAKLGKKGSYVVAEADESDGSFLKLDPIISVITNIEADHLDYYHNLENIIKAFSSFLGKLPPTGLAVLCFDDPHVRELAERFDGPYISYGIDSNAMLRALHIKHTDFGVEFDVFYHNNKLGQIKLCVPGDHNVNNALAAIAVCIKAGLTFEEIANGIASFCGAGRRFQVMGEVDGILVVDDYAHHPTEVKATLKAAQQKKYQRVIGVFQPHRYSRTFYLKDEFAEALSLADHVVLTDIYGAGEKPIANVSSELILKAFPHENNECIILVNNKEEIVDYLEKEVRTGDLVITLGAGNIWTVARDLVERLKQKHSCSTEDHTLASEAKAIVSY